MAQERGAQWYIEVLDAISDLVLVKGDRSKLLWANRAFLKHYGMSNEALRDLIDAPHSDPDDTVQYVKDDHRVFTTGVTLDIPAEPVTNSAGEVTYFHTVKNAIKNADGCVERTVGVSRRITDERIVEKSERERSQQKSSQQALKTLVRHIPLAVAMLDVKQRFLCYSNAWTDLFEHNEGPLLERFYDDLCEVRLPLHAEIDACIASADTRHLENCELRRSSGDVRVVSVTCHPWLFPEGAVGGAIIVVHDITQSTRSARELERLNDELMQFNYRVSHDLVAPLRTIRGYIDISLENIESDPALAKSMLSKMQVSVDRATALVENVLNLARADVREESLEEVDLTALACEVLNEHAEEFDAYGIKTSVQLKGPNLKSSRFRLKQILENFVSNAIKFHDRDKSDRYIHIRSQQRGTEIELEVADNGVGVDSALGESLFDIFVRGGANHPGSGLGLYLVRKHATRLGGFTSIPSHRDDTIFRITLPYGGPL